MVIALTKYIALYKWSLQMCFVEDIILKENIEI